MSITSPVSPGRHRHQVTLQRRTVASQGGTPVETWANVEPAPDWGFVQESGVANIERVFGAQVQAVATKVVEMRYRTVLQADRLIWHDHDDSGAARDRHLYVQAAIDPDGMRRKVIVAVVEHAA